MRAKNLLVGNWKMNLGPTKAREYAQELRRAIAPLSQTETWVAPPAISLFSVCEELRGSAIAVGSQNCHWAESGAFTGETAPSFITEIGATFTLTGHSERRQYFGETSESVAQRTVAALRAGLKAVVCFGESDGERVGGLTNSVIEAQLNPVLSAINTAKIDTADYTDVILAYEPVWAIGTGKVASIADIQSAHQHVQQVWSKNNLPGRATILYGGSVTPANFTEIIALEEVNGALVGGASLKLTQWLELIAIAEGKR